MTLLVLGVSMSTTLAKRELAKMVPPVLTKVRDSLAFARQDTQVIYFYKYLEKDKKIGRFLFSMETK